MSEAPPEQPSNASAAPAAGSKPHSGGFAAFALGKDEYTDERQPFEWKSRYAPEARRGINCEAAFLGFLLAIVVILTGFFLGLSGKPMSFPVKWLGPEVVFSIDFRLLAIFFSGWVGGVTFSVKWLVHSAAHGRWHLDRRYWRVLIPGLGGVYACVVLTLFDSGILVGHGQPAAEPRPIALAAALAFLVGYFSDGVSGLLSNIANAVFGTLEKK